jgi:hypothetical protein
MSYFKVTMTDNIFIEVHFNKLVIIGSCVNDYCIQWSNNPKFIQWLYEHRDDVQHEAQLDKEFAVYDEKYTREYKRLEADILATWDIKRI